MKASTLLQNIQAKPADRYCDLQSQIVKCILTSEMLKCENNVFKLIKYGDFELITFKSEL